LQKQHLYQQLKAGITLLKAEEAVTQVIRAVKAQAEKADRKEPRMTHAPKDQNITDRTVPQDNPWMMSIPIGKQLTKAKTAQKENPIPMNSQEYPTRRMMIK
jgi:hypothetical protein